MAALFVMEELHHHNLSGICMFVVVSIVHCFGVLKSEILAWTSQQSAMPPPISSIFSASSNVWLHL